MTKDTLRHLTTQARSNLLGINAAIKMFSEMNNEDFECELLLKDPLGCVRLTYPTGVSEYMESNDMTISVLQAAYIVSNYGAK